MKGRIATISRLLRERKLSAVELTESYISRASSSNRLLNAYVHECFAQARLAAERAQKLLDQGTASPLTGIPVAVKDNICTRGVPTTCCSRILQGYVPPYSAEAWSKLERCGAVLLGKTNMDEFAMGSSSETSCFGAPVNPLDTSLSAGGSSGGSAAAVAADIAVYSLGSDTGGSVRQPAAFCGIVGFRPTYGTISRSGLVAYASSFDQIGPLASSVEDAAIVYDAVRGRDCADMTSVNSASAPSLFEPDIKNITVGVPKEFFSDGVEEEVKVAVEAAICLYERAGAHIKHVSLPVFSKTLAAYYIISCAEASSNLGRYDGVRYGMRAECGGGVADMMAKTRTQGFGKEVRRRIMLGTFVLSGGYRGQYYKRACSVRAMLSAALEDIFNDCDVLVAPAAPTAPFALGTERRSAAEAYQADICTVPASMAGIPAVSLPCGITKSGMPVGMQVMAGRHNDGLALSVARYFEREADISFRLSAEVGREL